MRLLRLFALKFRPVTAATHRSFAMAAAAAVVVACAAGGCVTSPGQVGDVTAAWSGNGSDPAVRILAGTARRAWWSRYDFAFSVADNTTLNVDRGAAVALLLRDADGGRPAVIKLGSPVEPSTLNVERRAGVAHGRDQFFCRLYSGTVQVFLAHDESSRLPERPDDARVVVQLEHDPGTLPPLRYDRPAGSTPKGRSAGDGSDAHEAVGGAVVRAASPAASVPLDAGALYLTNNRAFGPSRIGGGGTTFAVSWLLAEPGSPAGGEVAGAPRIVYCATEPDSTVVAQQGDRTPVRVDGDRELEWDERRLAGASPAEETGDETAPRDLARYGRVIGAIRQLDLSTPAEVNRRLSAEHRYRSAYAFTQRVAGTGGNFYGVPGGASGTAGGWAAGNP
jgi:hypothetical protein